MKKENSAVQPLSPFDNKIHRMGRISTLIVWVFFLLVPFAVCMVFELNMDWILTIKAAAPIMLIFAVTGVCEKLSMSPIIGPGAVYLASSTGNIQNMKLPAALNAMNIMNCEEGSEKGRVISIICGGNILFRNHCHRILWYAFSGSNHDTASYQPGGFPCL